MGHCALMFRRYKTVQGVEWAAGVLRDAVQQAGYLHILRRDGP